jgi:CDGSH-type Zn-finger protein
MPTAQVCLRSGILGFGGGMTWRDRADGRTVSVTVCPDGPLLLRGADAVIDAEGVSHEVRRPCVALCRCGRSSLAPWCDGTHAVVTDAAGKRAAR